MSEDLKFPNAIAVNRNLIAMLMDALVEEGALSPEKGHTLRRRKNGLAAMVYILVLKLINGAHGGRRGLHPGTPGRHHRALLPADADLGEPCSAGGVSHLRRNGFAPSTVSCGRRVAIAAGSLLASTLQNRVSRFSASERSSRAETKPSCASRRSCRVCRTSPRAISASWRSSSTAPRRSASRRAFGRKGLSL